MNERLMEILVFLMSNLAHKELGEINTTLEGRGYSQVEISEALDWLYSNVQMDGGWIAPRVSSASRRQFHLIEKRVLSAEAQGYLMQLSELGLLEVFDLETVIEKAMATGLEKISASEIQALAASVLFSRPNRRETGLEASAARQGFMMSNKDTIH